MTAPATPGEEAAVKIDRVEISRWQLTILLVVDIHRLRQVKCLLPIHITLQSSASLTNIVDTSQVIELAETATGYQVILTKVGIDFQDKALLH